MVVRNAFDELVFWLQLDCWLRGKKGKKKRKSKAVSFFFEFSLQRHHRAL